MQISWKGQACFQLVVQRSKQESVKILIDPFDPSIGLKMPTVEADVVLSTHDHYDHNNIKAAKATSGNEENGPFVITDPGEYEVRDVFIRGISSWHDDVGGKERGQNTIYIIEGEGMRLCHLGDLGQKELTSDQVGQIGNIDILFVPVGGTYTIDAKEANKIIGQIEPRLVVPMHYGLSNLKIKLEKVDEFLSVMGVKNPEQQGKLNIKTRDLPAAEAKIVLLKPGG